MSLFAQHPLRHTLSDEIHARPPTPLQTPELVTYLAFLHHDGSAERERPHLEALADQLGLATPDAASPHMTLDAGTFRLKWERHNEFSSYTFFRRIAPGDSADENALLAVPAAWRREIPGQLIAATHIELRTPAEVAPEAVMTQASPDGKTLVATRVADGAGWVFTDFHIHADGFSRFLVIDAGLTPRQAGRFYQREAYLEGEQTTALHRVVDGVEKSRYARPGSSTLTDIRHDTTAVVRAVSSVRRRKDRMRATWWPNEGLVEWRERRAAVAGAFRRPLDRIQEWRAARRE